MQCSGKKNGRKKKKKTTTHHYDVSIQNKLVYKISSLYSSIYRFKEIKRREDLHFGACPEGGTDSL